MTVKEFIESLSDIKERDKNRQIHICGRIEDENGIALPVNDVDWEDTSDGILLFINCRR